MPKIRIKYVGLQFEANLDPGDWEKKGVLVEISQDLVDRIKALYEEEAQIQGELARLYTRGDIFSH